VLPPSFTPCNDYFFLRDSPALLYAIATACFCGFPASTSRRMFSLKPALVLAFFPPISGIFDSLSINACFLCTHPLGWVYNNYENIMSEKLYTQHDLEIELLKNNQNHLFKILDRIDTHQKWMLGIMGSGFFGLLGLMAHGFHWF
jgi:hypothetical protein